MPLITLPYDPAVGPTIRAEIAFPRSLTSAGAPRDERRVRTLLIDSGASFSSISQGTATDLDLPVLGLRPLMSVTQQNQAPEYLADMILPIGTPPLRLDDLRVVEFPMADEQVAGLLGRDILDRGYFTLNGVARTFTLGF